MELLPLAEAETESEFGGKAVSLGRALRAGISVPGGYALSYEWVEAVRRKDRVVLAHLQSAFEQMKKPIAVRSSAIGEDSAGASFAGQHTSVLNVTGFNQLVEAVEEVLLSGLTPAAMSYRAKLGITGTPQMGVVLQELHDSEAAGVMFTRNPMNGAEERVIEAAWGLGEIVVAGLVIPDYYRVSPEGKILERRIGEKDLAFRLLPQGGTEEVELPPEKAAATILDDSRLRRLHELALRCEQVYGSGLDIEWGLAGDELVLLQCRSITTSQD